MTHFRVTLLSSLIALAVSSCANNPDVKNSQKISSKNMSGIIDERAGSIKEVWDKTDPAVSYFDRERSLFVERKDQLPASVAAIQLNNFKIVDGTKLSHLNGYLRPFGLNVIFGSDSVSNSPLASNASSGASSSPQDIAVGIDGYTGTLGDFLSILEQSHNISFSYVGNNTLKISRLSNFIASVPQDAKVVDAVKKNLEALGAKGVVTDQLTGSVIYQATNQDQARITQFIDRFFENYAGIKMQITVFVVSVNENASDGFNWGELDVVLGHVKAAHAGPAIDNFVNNQGNTTNNGGTNTGGTNGSTTGGTNTGGTNTGGTNTGGTTGSTNTNNNQWPSLGYSDRYSGSSLDDIRGYSWLNKDKLKLGAFNNNISLSVALDWLNQYGSTRAEQSAFLDTVTGKTTTIESQRKIPYLGDESTSLVGSQNPIATQNSTLQEKEQGIKVEFTPYYDSSSQEVTIDLNINLKNYVGTTPVQRASGRVSNVPDIQEEKFPTTTRMKIGETKLLGGINFSSIQDDRSSLNLIKFNGSDYINQKLTKSAMFILIRPTVQVFRPDEFQLKGTSEQNDWVDLPAESGGN